MPGSLERPFLQVEGRDDKYALVNLLVRHGIDYDTKPWPPVFPEFKESGSLEQMLDGMETGVQASTGKPIGFVLDADEPLLDRWAAVRDRLRNVGVDAPIHPIPGGFIGYSETYKVTVGIWLMPDNQHDGKLETFLQELIDDHDELIGYAADATDAAKDLGAQFPPTAGIKAVLHVWLAWQKVPGVPYGTAIHAKYFRHDSPAANAFVSWFKRLYGLQ